MFAQQRLLHEIAQPKNGSGNRSETVDAKLDGQTATLSVAEQTTSTRDSLSKSIEQSLVPYENFIPGIVFRDISPILENPKLFGEIIKHFSARYSKSKIDAVVMLEARGFILGAALAYQLKLPIIMVRKAGKLPGEVYQSSYKKLYGEDTFVMRKNALKAGQRVIIIDDFYSTGGSLEAATKLVQAAGATIHEGVFLINNMQAPTKQSFSFPIYTIHDLKPPKVDLSRTSSPRNSIFALAPSISVTHSPLHAGSSTSMPGGTPILSKL